MAVIFFSYSHRDQGLRDQLETHLSMLKRQGVIETWHDRRILAGDELDGRIAEELQRADLILLLVSPDFLASNYCYDVEVRRAMERHEANEARVIPVILRPCDWHSAPFGKLLAAPQDGKPITSWADLDEAFLNVVQAIKSALGADQYTATDVRSRFPEGASPKSSPPSAGPRSSNLRVRKTFSEADKDRFLEDAFAFMSRFFESSLDELTARNEDIETSFRRIDANRFTAAIYRDGQAVSRCRIVLGGGLGHGITFSHSDRSEDGSFNESLSVEADDQSLFLKTLGMGHWGQREHAHLTHQGAAEYYWSMLMRPLQQ